VGKPSLNTAQPYAKAEGRMFLLEPAYPGCPGTKAVKWLLLFYGLSLSAVYLLATYFCFYVTLSQFSSVAGQFNSQNPNFWWTRIPWINAVCPCGPGILLRSIHQHIRLRIVVLLPARYLDIGITYVLRNISKSYRNFFLKFWGFWGVLMRLRTVKISGSDEGILMKRVGKNKIWPHFFPPYTLQIFWHGDFPSHHLLAKDDAPMLKIVVRGWAEIFFDFFSESMRSHFQACTTDKYFHWCVLQRPKLAKNLSTRVLIYAPVWEICPPKLTNFIVKFWQKNYGGLV